LVEDYWDEDLQKHIKWWTTELDASSLLL
jgi:hypothetical protein